MRTMRYLILERLPPYRLHAVAYLQDALPAIAEEWRIAEAQKEQIQEPEDRPRTLNTRSSWRNVFWVTSYLRP